MRHTYTKRDLKFTQDNLERLGYAGVAKKLGVTLVAIKQRCTYWRKEGHKFPELHTYPIGSIKKRVDGRKLKINGQCVWHWWIKTESGWKRHARITPRVVRESKPKSIKQIPMKRETTKPNQKKMPIHLGQNWITGNLNANKEIKVRKPDYKTKRVQIDRRTWVVVPATMTNETAIANYQQKYSR